MLRWDFSIIMHVLQIKEVSVVDSREAVTFQFRRPYERGCCPCSGPVLRIISTLLIASSAACALLVHLLFDGLLI